jgi:molybdopterin converting factor small subunit
MTVTVCFYSYFKDLTGVERVTEELPEATTLEQLYEHLIAKFPKLQPMKKATLIAVGLDYRARNYLLNEGDEVSLFPPVQGG